MKTEKQDSELDITAAQADQWLQMGCGLLIDVRFPEEIEIFGPIEDAHQLPLSFLQRFCGYTPDPHCEEFSVRDLAGEERKRLTGALVGYARQHTHLICVCRSGNRSVAAARLLRELDYKEAFSLVGGVNAWSEYLATQVPYGPDQSESINLLSR